MYPFELMVKHLLQTGHLSAVDYNRYIVSAVEQGIIKDITPKNYIMESGQQVGAIVELSDGSKFRISIFSPIGDSTFDYPSEVKQLDNNYFMGS